MLGDKYPRECPRLPLLISLVLLTTRPTNAQTLIGYKTN